MIEIAPGVYWLNGRASNFYLCADDSGLALIDAGIPKEEQIVFDAVDSLNRQLSDLTRIVITHADIDHAGSVAAIQAASGATVYAGAECAAFLSDGKSPQHLPRLMQWLANAFFNYKPLPKNVLRDVAPGDVLPILDGLQAHPTPGHTSDHFSFFSPVTGVLFAGDALKVDNGRLLRSPSRITADRHAANQSAINLLQLASVVIACGHGEPLRDHSSDDLMQLFNELRDETGM